MELDKDGFLVEHNFRIHGNLNSVSLPQALKVMEDTGFVVTFSEMVDGGISVYHHAHPELNFDVDRSVPLDSPDLLVWEPVDKIPKDMKLKFRSDEELVNVALKKIYQESLEYSAHEQQNCVNATVSSVYQQEHREMTEEEVTDLRKSLLAKQFFYDNFFSQLDRVAHIGYVISYEGRTERDLDLTVLCEFTGMDKTINALRNKGISMEFDPSSEGGLRMKSGSPMPFDISVDRFVSREDGKYDVRSDAELTIIALDTLYRQKLKFTNSFIENSVREETVAYQEDTGMEPPLEEINNFRILLEKQKKQYNDFFASLRRSTGLSFTSFSESSYEKDKDMQIASTMKDADFDKVVDILRSNGFVVKFADAKSYSHGLSIRDTNDIGMWLEVDRKVPVNVPADTLLYEPPVFGRKPDKFITRTDSQMLDIALRRMYHDSLGYTESNLDKWVEARKDYYRNNEWHEMTDKQIVDYRRNLEGRKEFYQELFKNLRKEAGLSFAVQHSPAYIARKNLTLFSKRLDSIIDTRLHQEKIERDKRIADYQQHKSELYQSSTKILVNPLDISTMIDMTDLDADLNDKKGNKKAIGSR